MSSRFWTVAAWLVLIAGTFLAGAMWERHISTDEQTAEECQEIFIFEPGKQDHVAWVKRCRGSVVTTKEPFILEEVDGLTASWAGELLQPDEPAELWGVERDYSSALGHHFEATSFLQVCGERQIYKGFGETPQDAIQALNDRFSCLRIDARLPALCPECP